MILRKCFKQLLFVALIFSFHESFSQNIVAVSVEEMNFIYCGVGNPIRIAMEKVACSKLKVSASEGATIEAGGVEGYYNLKTDREGAVTITITGGGSVVQKKLWAKVIPAPVANVTVGKQSGTLSVAEAIAVNGVIAKATVNLGFDAKCGILDYEVIVIKEDKQAIVLQNQSAGFNDAVTAVFKTITSGDRLIFSNIHARCPWNREIYTLNPMTFQVK